MLKYFNEFINESKIEDLGIKQSHVSLTQQHLLEHLRNSLRLKKDDDITFIGSAGKRANKNMLSHNINVIINRNNLITENNLNEDELFEFLKKQFQRIKIPVEIDESTNTMIFDWPIQGTKNKTVQIRAKLTENMSWIKWSRSCPLESKETKYTGKHREALLSAVTESVKKDITQYYNDKKLVKEYEQYLFHPEDGLFVIQKTFEGKNGILKKAIQLQGAKRLITTKPDDFAQLVFGDEVSLEDLVTYESIMKYVKSNKFSHPKKRNKIFEKFKKKCFEKQIEVPENI